MLNSMAYILVVDDDNAFTDLLALILANDGYKVITAQSAEEALQKIAAEPPDLVISDVEMPGMSGFELVKTLQENPIFRKIPIMLMSARRVSSADRVGGLSLGSDDYLLKPIISQELLARVKAVLRRTEIGLDANPLTRLPGNATIHQVFEKKIQTKEPFAALYADLNHFKAYNDRYGFLKGDDVIRFTSQVLVSITQALSGGKDFVGHIGGDDFIVVTVPERAETLAEAIIQEFVRGVPSFYNEEDRRKGILEIIDRQGNPTKVPLMGLAIGIVSNAKRPIEQVGEISQIGAELKSYAKKLGGSRYVFDRRGAPD
jgi:diguanylate cyclase (GGDEF)-like protein